MEAKLYEIICNLRPHETLEISDDTDFSFRIVRTHKAADVEGAWSAIVNCRFGEMLHKVAHYQTHYLITFVRDALRS